MAHVHETESYDASPDEIWGRIGDFHGLHTWHPAIAGSQAKEGGSVRVLTLEDGGEVRETLVEDGDHTYTYAIDESPLPVAEYEATLAVTEGEDGGSTVDWTADFEPDGATAAEAEAVIAGIFRAGLDAL